MTWDEMVPLELQIAENFVEEASGYESQIDFLRGMYQDLLIERRRERDRERKARRRAIAQGTRGFVIEEVACPRCGNVFGRLKWAVGRPKRYCTLRCEHAARQARHRLRNLSMST